jgi:hypothetical protein
MITCSRDKNSDLFFAALGGLGQFGVITRARIRLERAPKRARWVRLAYSDVGSFTRDQELLISPKREGGPGFDYIEGQVQLHRTLTEGRRSSSFFSASELDRSTTSRVQCTTTTTRLPLLIRYKSQQACFMLHLILTTTAADITDPDILVWRRNLTRFWRT